MELLVGIVATVALLCGTGAILGRMGGSAGVIGGLLVGAGGIITGSMIALVLGLALCPGACVAVLCTTCYQPPTSDQIWAFGVTYFAILGGLGGLVPNTAFRAGYGVGSIAMLSAGSWAESEAAPTVLVGMAAWILAWGVRRALTRWLSGGSDALDGTTAAGFWDGNGWSADPSARTPSGGGPPTMSPTSSSASATPHPGARTTY